MIPSAAKWIQHRSPAWLVLFLAMVSTAVSPRTAAARTWHVPGDAPTIQAGIDLAQPGDDVLVAPGTYYEHDIEMKGGVCVHSGGGPAVTLVDGQNVSRVFDCNRQAGMVTLEGFAIRNGYRTGNTEEDASGGGVRCIDSQVTIRSCLISDCASTWHGGGIYGDGSDLDIESSAVDSCSARYDGGGIHTRGPTTFRLVDTEILGNIAGDSDGGVYAGVQTAEVIRCVVSGNVAGWGSPGGMAVTHANLTIQDCLISHNEAYSDLAVAAGLGLALCSGTIEGCTIASNSGSPPSPAVYIEDSNVQFERTLIGFNDERAVECWYGAVVAWHCCDLYGNAGGDQICGDDLGGNFTADPLFCNHEDYTLDINSPCLPGNHPDGVDCGLIGARGQGCGGTPTKPTTWGRIKAGFR